MRRSFKHWSAVALAMLALAGCTIHLNGGAVAGSDVRRLIDDQIAPQLKAYDPKLRVGETSCPAIIVQASKPSAACTLWVNDVELPILVDTSHPEKGARVAMDGNFFEIDSLNKAVAYYAREQSGIAFTATCPGRPVMVFATGTILTCALHGSAKAPTARIKIMSNGSVFVYNLPGIAVRDPVPAGLLHAHKVGRPAILSGAQAEAFIGSSIHVLGDARAKGAVVACPPSLDLSGTKTEVCTVRYPAMAAVVHTRLSILPIVGLSSKPMDVPLDRAKIQLMAQDDLNRRMAEIGGTIHTTVDCGRGFTVVPVGGNLSCKMLAGTKKYRLVVHLQDSRGTVSWHGVPL